MKIQLKDIPAEGKAFFFSRKDGRLDAALHDLTGARYYEAEVFIQPMGSAYVVTGKGSFTGEDLCSQCGWETAFELSGKIDEYLVIEKERGRSSHSPHGNNSLELENEGPETTYLTSSILDFGEFIHEQFALMWPDYPKCSDEKGCELHRAESEKQLLQTEEPIQETNGHPAFRVLDKLKKDH
jgi:uncharacterized metal-binding protein YceD (DUF177 family)